MTDPLIRTASASSASLIIVEGRNDVRNLLNCGVKNAISADGSGNIKQELIDLANGKESVTVAIDGDRGGEMLFMQLYDMMKVDHVAQAPVGRPRLRLVLVHGEAFASHPH